ncbi:hypothetical protein GOP47_0017928 [Adiantum capillus-veneris]|uniref:Uncharacterized protein n=1 Tax=Adiantum capillus-veneris TaxID=13818 RepID=A0A9D4UGD9_ADICA|nr:hypothetical protein GOP47_0017928 [Adiantum capillus-veneris]
MLKARFRILLKRCDMNLRYVPDLVVAACLVLHNLCIFHGESFDMEWVREAEVGLAGHGGRAIEDQRAGGTSMMELMETREVGIEEAMERAQGSDEGGSNDLGIEEHYQHLLLMPKETQHIATEMEVEPLQLLENIAPLPPDGEEVHGSPRSPRELWRKVKRKYHLVEFHALPDYLRDNEFILAHYRANWPLKQTLWSIFTIHNETLNIWTHLIGFIIFLGLTIYTIMKLPAVVPMPAIPGLPHLPNMSDLQKIPKDLLSSISASLTHLHVPEMITNAFPEGLNLHIPEVLSNCLPEALLSANRTNQCVLTSVKDDVANMIAPLFWKPIPRWPFFIFLGGAMFCLLASSVCHLFTCHSERVAYIMLRVDYAGIAALIASSFYPPVYYSFMCNPVLRNIYLTFITVVGIATVLVSLVPVFQNPEYRKVRAGLFFGMGLSGIAPVMHKLILFWGEPEALYTTIYEMAMGFFYGLGALVYATRVPERWKPGRFDIAGHSHQLFHVLVVAGAYTHYHAGLLYLKWRDMKGCVPH